MPAAIYLGALGLGALLFVRSRGKGPLERSSALVLPGLISVACVQSLHIWLGSPWSHWNASRLAPAAAMLRGIDAYSSPEAGSIQSTLYPPISYLAFLPAAWAQSPTAAILVGNALAQLYTCAVPVTIFCLLAGHGRRGLCIAALAASFFVLFGTLFQPTAYYLANIHADAPALFFGMLACAFAAGRPAARPWRLWATAACTVLSVSSKQSLAPAALALVLYLGWSQGRRSLAHFAAAALVVGGLAAGVMLTLVPARTLLFHTVTLPASFPLKPGGIPEAAREFLLVGWPALATLALAAGLRIALAERPRRTSLRDWAQANPAFLLVVVAMLLTPLSVIADAKYGGMPNSFHNLYFVRCATLCLLIEGARRATTPGRERLGAACAAMLLAFPVGLALANGYALRGVDLRRQVETLYDNPQQVAYEYTLEHPGEAWFPWNPLSNLLAEGRLDHQDRAVADWHVAGQELTPERLLEGIPSSVTFVAYPPDATHRFIAWALRQREPVAREALPGWKIYALPERRDAPAERRRRTRR